MRRRRLADRENPQLGGGEYSKCSLCHAMHIVHILCHVIYTYIVHFGTLWHTGVARGYNGQLHPNSSQSPIQLHFDKYSTGRTVLSTKGVHNAHVESGDKYSAGQTVLSIKGSAYGVGAFSTMSQWWVGVCKGERNNRLFQKANSDLIQFSLRTRIEHLKLGEIAWAWEYLKTLTVHWKWKLRNQAALKARFAKGSSLQNQQHCGKSLIKFPKAENIYALNSLQVVQTLCCCADSSEVGTFESATKF